MAPLTFILSILPLLIFILPSVTPQLTSIKKDLTVLKNTNGLEVVEATLDKIKSLQVFPPDYGILKRIAFIESDFGQQRSSKTAGGIWRVSPTQLQITQTSSNFPALTSILSSIEKNFQIDWNEVQLKDLRRPLHSALAASLYLSTLTPIPVTLTEQAQYWKKHYHPNANPSVQEFVQKVEKFEMATESECGGKMDLVVVLDDSGSVPQPDYKLSLDFVAKLLSSYSIENVRSGFIVYDSTVRDIFTPGQFKSVQEIVEKVKQVPYIGAGTETNSALARAYKMFDINGTTLEARPGVPRVMVLFTDGHSNNGVSNSVQLNGAGILCFAVGIGSSINQAELKQIAGSDASRVYTLKDFDALKGFLRGLRGETCQVLQRPLLNQTIEDSLKSNEKRFYSYDLPSKGLTVTLKKLEGKIRGFWSYTYKRPSAALSDGTIKGMGYIKAKGNAQIFVSVKGINKANRYRMKMDEGNQRVKGRGGRGGSNKLYGRGRITLGNFRPLSGNGGSVG